MWWWPIVLLISVICIYVLAKNNNTNVIERLLNQNVVKLSFLDVINLTDANELEYDVFDFLSKRLTTITSKNSIKLQNDIDIEKVYYKNISANYIAPIVPRDVNSKTKQFTVKVNIDLTFFGNPNPEDLLAEANKTNSTITIRIESSPEFHETFVIQECLAGFCKQTYSQGSSLVVIFNPETVEGYKLKFVKSISTIDRTVVI